MKELETHLKLKDKTELNIKKQQEVEYILEGTIKPKRGHIVWEINEETGEINPAEYKSDTISFVKSLAVPSEKLVIKKDCVYIPALNIKNAKKKYLNNKEQSYYFKKDALLNLSDLTFK
jgi:hypothetical protein